MTQEPALLSLFQLPTELRRTLLRLALIRLGYTPIEAVNGQDALEKVKQYRPIAAILDLRMPVMDGNKAASLILDTGLGIPLIAYTAADTDEIPDKSHFSYILASPHPCLNSWMSCATHLLNRESLDCLSSH